MQIDAVYLKRFHWKETVLIWSCVISVVKRMRTIERSDQGEMHNKSRTSSTMAMHLKTFSCFLPIFKLNFWSTTIWKNAKTAHQDVATTDFRILWESKIIFNGCLEEIYQLAAYLDLKTSRPLILSIPLANTVFSLIFIVAYWEWALEIWCKNIYDHLICKGKHPNHLMYNGSSILGESTLQTFIC